MPLILPGPKGADGAAGAAGAAGAQGPAGAGGDIRPRTAAGYNAAVPWYPVGVAHWTTFTASVAIGANSIYYVPLMVAAAVSVDALGMSVGTAGAGGALVRLGIFASKATGFYPGALLLDAGTIDAATTGIKTITGLTLNLTAGVLYHVALFFNDAAIQPLGLAASPVGAWVPFQGSDVISASNNGVHTLTEALAFGALPANAAADNGFGSAGRRPIPWIRFKDTV